MAPRTIILERMDIYKRTYSISSGNIVSEQGKWYLSQKKMGWSDNDNCRETIQEKTREMAEDGEGGGSLILVYNKNLKTSQALKAAKILEKVLNDSVPANPRRRWGGETVFVEKGNTTCLGVLTHPTSLWTSKYPFPHIMFSLIVAAEETARRLIRSQAKFFSDESKIWGGIHWPFPRYRKNTLFLKQMLLAEKTRPYCCTDESYGLRRAFERHGYETLKAAVLTALKEQT